MMFKHSVSREQRFMKKVAAVATSIAFFAATQPVVAAPGPYWYPVANSGVQWKSSTGAANWTNVNEEPCNANLDYNYTTSTTHQDLYRVDISDLPNGTVLNTIRIEPCWSLYYDDGVVSSSTINVLWRWNGGAPQRLNQNRTAGTGTVPYYSGPSTWTGLALVKDAGSTLDIGVRLTSQELGNNPNVTASGARLSRIRVRFYQ